MVVNSKFLHRCIDTQMFFFHGFYNHSLVLRRISFVWYSFWHSKTPHLLDSISYCLTNGVQFSRMRAFYMPYEESPEITRLAMYLGWTRNVAILERCGSNEERTWYIRAVLHFGWKKAKLLAAIESQAWMHSSLDEQALSCYTEEKEVFQESESDEENTLCVPWKYLPQSDDRVRDEGLGQEGWAGVTISYRIGGNQPGGDRQPSLSSSASQVGRTWDLLRRSHSTADHQCRLREVRFSDWHGQSQPPGYVPYLWRRFFRQAASPDGLHQAAPRCSRPVVHRRFRGDLAGCAGGMPWATA